MNGTFNTTGFVLGMALANNLPRNEAATTGLAASQFPKGSILGPIMLKPLIDSRADAEARAKRAEDALAAASASPKGLTGIGSGTFDWDRFVSAFTGTRYNPPAGFGGIWGGAGGGGGGIGGGGGLAAGIFAMAGVGDAENRELRRRLEQRDADIEDVRNQQRREVQRIQEEAGDQMREIRRAADRELDDRRGALEDEAREARRELQRIQDALADRARDLEVRERRAAEAEAAAKGGKR